MPQPSIHPSEKPSPSNRQNYGVLHVPPQNPGLPLLLYLPCGIPVACLSLSLSLNSRLLSQEQGSLRCLFLQAPNSELCLQGVAIAVDGAPAFRTPEGLPWSCHHMLPDVPIKFKIEFKLTKIKLIKSKTWSH